MKKLIDHTRKTTIKNYEESEYGWDNTNEEALELEMVDDMEAEAFEGYGSEEFDEYAEREEQYMELDEEEAEEYTQEDIWAYESEEEYAELYEGEGEEAGGYAEVENCVYESEEEFVDEYIEQEDPEEEYAELYEGEGEEAGGYAEVENCVYESEEEFVDEYIGQEDPEEEFDEYVEQEEEYIEEHFQEYESGEESYKGIERENVEYIDQGEAAYNDDISRTTETIRNKAEKRSHKKKSGSMELIDKVLLAAGACILIVVIVAMGVFVNARFTQNQVAVLANVGLQLEGIHVIGEHGLQAVAAAAKEKLTLAAVPTEEPADPKKDYNEIDYSRQVSIEPNFTSIQKDLKIKFINKNSDKLVPNVPFSVTVVAPDGKSYIWSDDDMDGIIYKTDIAPGTYQVAMETLTDARYADYTVSTSVRSVEVKKEIVYEKVDVSNEVKKETEVNAAKEDTKINETVVESVLQDTVAWVESKVIAATYNEVAKSTIPDPITLVRNNNQSDANRVELVSERKASGTMEVTLPHAEVPTPDSSEVATPVPTEVSTPVPTEAAPPIPTEVVPSVSAEVATPLPTEVVPSVPAEVATPLPTEVVPSVPAEVATPLPTEVVPSVPAEVTTPVPTEAPTPIPAETPVPTPVVTPMPAKGTIAVNETTLAGSTGGHINAKAVVAGFAEDRKVVYSIRTDNSGVATASIDEAGNIDVYGVAVGTTILTVTANYENGTVETEASVNINVTIGGIMALTLDVTSLTTFVQTSATIHANITNMFSADPTVTAETSDSNIVTVSVDKKAVTVTGVAEGNAVVTIKYVENGIEVSATCAVTVKANPKQDTTTLLKDEAGRQLYVMDGNTYREAVYADYYSAEKFFLRGEARYTGWQTIDGKMYFFTADGNKVTGEQVIQGAKYNFASDGSLMTSDGTLGIDVSKWNGTIDWNAVKNSGISYVIIRCGYRGSSAGKLIEDPKFESNIKGATAAGLKVGIYFFTQAVNEIEAVEEASMVLDQIKGYTISYPVFVDVEASGGRGDKIDKDTRTAVCRAFCQTIQRAGYTAGVYSNKTWLEGKLDAASLNNYKIWLAQYAATPTYAGRYDIWQYKSTGSISGISGNVDMNISYLGY